MPQPCPILSENVANMAPTWVPRWSQNGEKIDAKIDQKIDASWDRFLEGFGRFLGAKMRPCSHPTGSNIEANCEKRFFEKSLVLYGKTMIFKVRGFKLGVKINQKSIKKGVQHGKASWHGFLNDFGGFREASWG